MKYFHLLSDDKTVREISWEKYRKLCMGDRSKVLALAKSWLNIRKGKHYVKVNLKQLEEILRDG